MNAASSVSGIIVTAGIVALAILFAWKGDAAHAMVCVVALLPAAGGAAASLTSKATEPPAVAVAVTAPAVKS